MKKILLYFTFSAILLSSCSEKEKSNDIIVPAPVQEVKKGPQQMAQTNQKRSIEWCGQTYNIKILRMVDKSLPLVTDENEYEYYDNTITLTITRQDGSEVLNKTFKKSDFATEIKGSGFEKNGAMLGIVFDKIENNKLIFATSIGSPDMGSDEFLPLIMTIDRNMHISVKIDTTMDGDNINSSGGITGDEEA